MPTVFSDIFAIAHHNLLRLRHALRWLWGQVAYRPFFGYWGRKVVIEKPMLIANPRFIYIGDGVLIRSGVRLEAVLAHGRKPKIRIGDGCNIEQNVHIVSHSRVTIGRQVSITANCAIVDVTHPYDGDPSQPIGSQVKNEDSFVEIGDGCFLGIGSIVLPNVRLGRGCVVGANSVVNRSFPAGSIVAGSPARLLGSRSLEHSTPLN